MAVAVEKASVPVTPARLRRRSAGVLGLAIIVAAIFADRNGWLLVKRQDDMATYHGVKINVQRVIAGDMLDIPIADVLNGKSTTRVALWGVDCPDLARAGRDAQPLAEDAAAFTASSVASNMVILWLEPHRTRDAQGHVLAHVELPDGTKLNELLLDAGLAKIDERWPHSMVTRYAQVEASAKRRKAGMWRGISQRMNEQFQTQISQ